MAEVIAEIKKNINNRKLDNKEITLVGVTKKIDTDRMMESYHLGIKQFGESYAQELNRKHEWFSQRDCFPKWHFIGHLQRKKVKQIIDKVFLIHSVDRLELAKEIQKQAYRMKKAQDILIQVKLFNEPDKSGIKEDELESFYDQILKFDNINVKGLMLLPPYFDNPEEVRPFFKRLVLNSTKIFPDKNVILSMGMSNDYQVALEEGTTMVRIGTSIYGARI